MGARRNTYLALRRCQGPEVTDCDDLDFLHGTSFLLPIDNGWAEKKASVAWVPGSSECWLTYGYSTVVQNGPGVILQLWTYEDHDPSLPEGECLPETASERGDTMACASYERIMASPPLD